MSSPILPITDPFGPPTATGGDVADLSAFVSGLDACERALTIEATRGGPPADVLDDILAAGARYDELRRAGLEMVFTDAADGRAVVELLDGSGQPRELTIVEAFEIAAGAAE
jgi:hypothetical protein